MRRLMLLFSTILMIVLISACDKSKDQLNKQPDSQPVPSSIEHPEMHVMSFNIRYGSAGDGPNRWELRKPLVTETIKTYNPDVLGVQEALDFQLDYITQALPEYTMIGVGRDDGKTKGEYSAILYKTGRFSVENSGTFWLSDTPDEPGSITWGNACTRICTWARLTDSHTGKSFTMFNLHLDHVSRPSRLQSAQLILQRIADNTHGQPVIVTGDFNAFEDSPEIMLLKNAACTLTDSVSGQSQSVRLVDTYRVIHPDAADTSTFHGFKNQQQETKIDYIFVYDAVKVLDANIARDQWEGRYPSDHYPVWAVVTLE